ncbi:hypothetical protein ACIQ9M_15555 [Streptomyces californicus]|uniref:hypothetical protein n=1 Tax=Streptomyces californicus TaxID=67351 RepID=UPI0036B5CCB5
MNASAEELATSEEVLVGLPVFLRDFLGLRFEAEEDSAVRLHQRLLPKISQFLELFALDL